MPLKWMPSYKVTLSLLADIKKNQQLNRATYNLSDKTYALPKPY